MGCGSCRLCDRCPSYYLIISCFQPLEEIVPKVGKPAPALSHLSAKDSIVIVRAFTLNGFSRSQGADAGSRPQESGFYYLRLHKLFHKGTGWSDIAGRCQKPVSIHRDTQGYEQWFGGFRSGTRFLVRTGTFHNEQPLR